MSEPQLKREFITTWTEETVHAQTQKMSISQARFFDRTHSSADPTKAMIPHDMPFLDLIAFSGKKTKVTIEIIPW